jgi:hypothetical protein
MENSGKLTKKDSGNAVISTRFNNSGRVVVDGGALNISGDVANSGQFQINAGTLQLSGNSTHSATASSSGAGTLVLSGGTHSFADGFSDGGAGLTDLQSGSLLVVSGHARLGTTKVNGNIQGAGNLTIANASITAGTMSGTGSTILASDGTHSLSGGSQFINGGRTLRNDGQLSVGSAGHDVYIRVDGSSGATPKSRLVNQGEMSFQGTRSSVVAQYQGNGDAEMENSGKLTKKDSGNAVISTRFNNSGRVVVDGGALNISGKLTNQGDIHVQQGQLSYTGGAWNAPLQNDGKIVIDSGARLSLGSNASLVNNGRLMGNGSLELLNANLENHGVVAPGASAGTLSISGNYVQGADGRLDIELGGLLPGVDFDRLQVSGNATLNGVLDVTHLAGYAPKIGDSFIVLASSRLYGTFSSLSLHGFGNGTQINVSYLDGADADSYADYVRLDVAAVPEPETYAMMLAGLGVVGWSLRKRKLAMH